MSKKPIKLGELKLKKKEKSPDIPEKKFDPTITITPPDPMKKIKEAMNTPNVGWTEVYDSENIKLKEQKKALKRQWSQCKNYFRKGERPSQKSAIKNMDEMIDEL